MDLKYISSTEGRRHFQHEFPTWLKQGIWFGSYLVFPFLVVVLLFQSTLGTVLTTLLLSLGAFFLWMRFLEPSLIRTKHISIPFETNVTIVTISDLHVGIFGKSKLIERVVKRINTLNPRYVFIAGDFTLDPKPSTLKQLLKPLSAIDAPVYAVLGGHDLELPGPPLRAELEAALAEHDVTLLNNGIVDLPEFQLIGLGDYTANEDDLSAIPERTDKPQIVLTHNPDTTLLYTKPVDLTICGHTHAGQIRIPWLYKKIIPTHGSFDVGLTVATNLKLYISSGLGESGLPMRFLNPPTIDHLILKPQISTLSD